MDVDETYSERGGRGIESVFAKSEQLSVSFYADLPMEVSQILKNAGAHFHRPSIIRIHLLFERFLPGRL
jgi:hypothetical protein